MAQILQIPTNELDLFIRSTEVSSYLPGRVRLYHKDAMGNPKLADKIKNYLASFPEITKTEVNTVSGSILILYDVEKLRKNPKLKKVEDYIRRK